jgi:hypothetical protein
MKQISILVLAVALVLACPLFAQAPPNAFDPTSFSFNLSPISLPGLGTTLAGAETDALFSLSTNNNLGMTTLVGNSTFLGGRYERVIPQVANYLQNHTALTGGNYEFGITSSVGVVKVPARDYWGGRAGFFLKYAPAGSQSFNIAFEAQANYLPEYGGTTSPHWVASIAVGPNFRF